jgi:hypothetical protein
MTDDGPEQTDGHATVARGTAIGRYIVLAPVGQGGMGEVFAAYDPELDRKVALKLLRAESGSRGALGRGRLLREAKSIARLSHPNVVVVHDAGTFDERVFVAMEFVEGQTVAAWLADHQRTQREIMDVFLAAARGLSAAHAAGLVHRDFKPQNVMVGSAGQVRVMDFGLARTIGSDGDGEAADRAKDKGEATDRAAGGDAHGVPAQWDVTLTRTGELLGTPLYMAPEQFQARRADAQADQFSFCVALYQALYGVHPFRCETLVELVTNVARGAVQPPPPKSAVPVPAWLRRVLLRGLAVEPAARWPSMNALMTALQRDPARARRRGALGVVVLLAAIGAGLGLWRVGQHADALCQSGASRFAGLWEINSDGPRRQKIHDAFIATGLDYARDTWERVAALLNGYSTRWLGMYRDSCEATHVRGEQSAEVLDLRTACLDERLTRLRALVEVLSTVDRDAVAHAVDAANALPSLDRCADVRLLRAPVEPPATATERAQVEALRTRAAVVDAMNVTGRHREALALGRGVIADARAVGYRPLLAELLERLWVFNDFAAHGSEAAKDLEESIWLAVGTKRDDVAAEAGALLCGVVGYSLARHEDGDRWAAFTTALLDRLGPGHDVVRAWLLQDQSAIRLQTQRLDEALTLLKEALALKQRALPANHPDIGYTLIAQGEVLFAQGDAAAALTSNLRGQEIFLRAYGPSGPWLAQSLSNQGEYLVALGRYAEAIPKFRDALHRWESQVGPDHRFLAYPLVGMGVALWKAGQAAEAVAPLERALRIRATNEPDQATVAQTRFSLARVLWDLGRDRPRARQLTEAARAVYERDPARVVEAGEITRWLAAHPGVR